MPCRHAMQGSVIMRSHLAGLQETHILLVPACDNAGSHCLCVLTAGSTWLYFILWVFACHLFLQLPPFLVRLHTPMRLHRLCYWGFVAPCSAVVSVQPSQLGLPEWRIPIVQRDRYRKQQLAGLLQL